MSRIGNRPWSPSDITTYIWYDASDSGTITHSAGSVSQWNDKSGLGNHVSEGTGSLQPTTGKRQLNGLNVIDFDGSERLINNGGLTGIPTGGKDVYVVGISDNEPNGSFSLKHTVQTNSRFRFNTDPFSGYYITNDAGTLNSVSGTLYDNDPHISSLNYDGDFMSTYRDGTIDKGPTDITANQPLSINIIGLATNDFLSAVLNGAFAEFILTDHLSDADRQKMEGYLAWKWGLVASLPVNHPFKYYKPQDNISAASLWTPGGITTAAWYDASDESTITYSGTLVSQLGVLDLTANGGVNPHTGNAWAAGDTYRLAFVSSLPMDATSSDIEHYNMHVQNVAAAAGYGSVTWKAVVSTSTVNAKKNIGVGYPDGAIVNMIGNTFPATSWDDLFDGTVSPKIAYDENGNGPGLADLPSSVPFYQFTPCWTGIDNNGNTENPVGGATVNHGIAEAEATFQWDRSSSTSTTQKMHIYAISEPLTVQYNSSAISQWNDKSGNANHAAQGTGAKQPLRSTRTIGGLRTIEGTDDDLFFDTATGFFSAQDDWSMFAVYQDDDYAEGVGNDMLIQNLDGAGTGRSLIYRTTTNQMTSFLGGTATSLYAQPSTPVIMSVTFDWNGSTTSIASWLNGSAGGTGSVSTEANTASNIRLLGDKAGTACFDGIVGEIIIVNSVVSTADRQKIEGYLAWKWGFAHQLPRNHPYANMPPTA